MISAVGEVESVVRCIELGAEDYLPKPFDATLLRARVGASLEKKALRDEVRDWNRKLEERVQEQLAQLNRLGRLKGFFSPQLAESIINGGGEDLLKTHRCEVVVVFLDLRGFTAFTDSCEPEEVMWQSAQVTPARACGPWLHVSNSGCCALSAGAPVSLWVQSRKPMSS